MIKTVRPDSPMLAYLVAGLLVSAGGVLATPLAAAPLVLLALIATILMLAGGRGTLQLLGQETAHARNVLLIAFGAWFMAEMISTVLTNQRWASLDYPLRFMLGMGVFWIIRYTTSKQGTFFFYSIAVSAVAAAVMALYQHVVLGMDRPQGWTNYPIYFGNLSILLCVYAAVALSILRDRLTFPMRSLLIAAIPLLGTAAFLSGSRSSWLGLAGLLVLLDWRELNRIRLICGGAVIAVFLAIILVLVPELAASLRLIEAAHDIQEIFNGNYSTSIGYRLLMWKAALHMFWSSPLFGIGSGYYESEVAKLVATGAIDIQLMESGRNFNQPHSEIMDILATKGLTGLVAYVTLLALPFRLFRSLSEGAVAETKAFARMGQATIIAFLMFGLTLATFKIQIYCAIYPLTIALLAALALNHGDQRVDH